jgi:hypothetical protein
MVTELPPIATPGTRTWWDVETQPQPVLLLLPLELEPAPAEPETRRAPASTPALIVHR